MLKILVLFVTILLSSGNSADFNVDCSKDDEKILELLSKNIDSNILGQNELNNIQNELKRIQYQNQFIKLNNKVMDVDTENKVLAEQVKIQKDYFETALKEQQERYEVELEQQTLIYGIALGALTIIGFILSLLGVRQLMLYVNGIVKHEHKNAITEITEQLSSDSGFQKRVEAFVKIEVEKQSGISFEKEIE